MKSADVSQELSEDTRLLRTQLGLKRSHDLLGASLTRDTGLESDEGPDVHQQLIMLCCGRKTRASLLKLLLSRTICSLWPSQIISLLHFGQQRGGVQDARRRLSCFHSTTEVRTGSIFISVLLSLYLSILKKKEMDILGRVLSDFCSLARQWLHNGETRMLQTGPH